MKTRQPVAWRTGPGGGMYWPTHPAIEGLSAETRRGRGWGAMARTCAGTGSAICRYESVNEALSCPGRSF